MRKTFPPRLRNHCVFRSSIDLMKSLVSRISLCALLASFAVHAGAEIKSIKVDSAGKMLINDAPAKLWGLRTAGAAASDAATTQLIAALPDLKENGCNMLLVCYQGSAGLTLKTFSAEGTSFEDTAVRDRVRKILEAASSKDMLVVVS